ncbi:hypothetical protein ACWGQT_12535 [Streptomyces yangpuensis]
MDQGLSALIAAGFGVVGTMVGGAAAVWGAKIGAERSARAVGQQVQDQAAAEHAHWLRQQRSEAYELFEDSYHEVDRLVQRGEEQDIAAARESIRSLHRREARIEILGPQAVAENSKLIVEALALRIVALTAMYRLNSGLDGTPEEGYAQTINSLTEDSEALAERWSEYHRDFIEAAQQVMGSYQERRVTDS